MPLYNVSLSTDSTTYITTVESEELDDEYELALLAVARIKEDDGFDLSQYSWDFTIEELG
jgi:hypothetical protein